MIKSVNSMWIYYIWHSHILNFKQRAWLWQTSLSCQYFKIKSNYYMYLIMFWRCECNHQENVWDIKGAWDITKSHVSHMLNVWELISLGTHWYQSLHTRITCIKGINNSHFEVQYYSCIILVTHEVHMYISNGAATCITAVSIISWPLGIFQTKS